ncbi:MAG TPA: DUF5107 domain-containing protein, partial [Fimbriimonadaceae bacterium]|nr:DUF5107 domain-containing protein [Fimbriimonadaceae bacterium]
RQAGFVHVADRHIAPGKKQWTWGNHPFGWAWDRNLTDSDGPYVELMAGTFTDNQPDFSFLMPYETREFKQVWYPIQGIGPATNATEEAAISVRLEGGTAFVGISTSCVIDGRVVVEFGDEIVEDIVRIGPGGAWRGRYEVGEADSVSARFFDCLWSREGRLVVESTVTRTTGTVVKTTGEPPVPPPKPRPATEPLLPDRIESVEELYLTGLHLWQYRHATRKPEAYWREALRRDPLDSRCNSAMADWHLRRGEYALAEEFARKAIERLTARNPNPREGEAFYLLGMALERQGRFAEATDAYKKATWNHAWASAAKYRLACVLLKSSPPPLAGLWGQGNVGEDRRATLKCREADRKLAELDRLLSSSLNRSAIALDATLCRLQGKVESARVRTHSILFADPLDLWAAREARLAAEADPSASESERRRLRWLYKDAMRGDPQNYLDLAIDYADAGLVDQAIAVLDEIADAGDAMVAYARAYYAKGAQGGGCPVPGSSILSPQSCALFPSRLEDIEFLKAADPGDAQAAYLLGNLYYDRGRHEEAIAEWERAVRNAHQPESQAQDGPGTNRLEADATAWRNLGIAYFNVGRDPAKARDAFDKAVAANPRDARIAYERDQLLKRTGEPDENRLNQIDPNLALERDDFTLELCSLLTETGKPDEALAILQARRFAPWEGGEGVALREWTRVNLALGERAIGHDPEEALAYFEAAENPPENLGEARHLLANASDVWYWLGEALSRLGRDDEARTWWSKAAEFKGDFQEMAVRAFSEMTRFQALALSRLGREEGSRSLLENLLAYANELEKEEAKIDYFATSL